jgi:hypothetical protein
MHQIALKYKALQRVVHSGVHIGRRPAQNFQFQEKIHR